jgi:hypothetical protein
LTTQSKECFVLCNKPRTLFLTWENTLSYQAAEARQFSDPEHAKGFAQTSVLGKGLEVRRLYITFKVF